MASSPMKQTKSMKAESKNQQYKELYQDLLQQIHCEKKLNQSMTDVLENKISAMMADNASVKL